MMNLKVLHVAAASFEAARYVDGLPADHRSRRLHGHSFLANVRCTLPDGWAGFPGGEVEQLRGVLESSIGLLDYRFLNEQLDQPTDENLARWLRERLASPEIEQIGIRSARHGGVDLDASGRAHVWRRYTFQSAHRLPYVPLGHKCGRMHGHGFAVILHAGRDTDRSDQSINCERLDELWAPLHFELNYGCLNDIPGLENPTSEILSSWIWSRLKPLLPQLSWVTVYETASCGASYDGQRYRIWKELTLDSAMQLKRAPGDSLLRRIHGHTYTLRLHLCAPLDEVMGWTVDFGDVKEIFRPIFKALDHCPLHEIPDLADCDTASIATWILKKSRAQLPQLDRVDLYETQGCGAIVSAGEHGLALPV